MDVISVTCNHCGAPLEVGERARFVTCRYCNTQLEIKRSASAVYTEVLSRIDQRTERMAEDLAVIRRQNELEALDREWALKRDSLMIRGKHGRVSEPSATAGCIGAAIAGVFGVFWTIMAAGIGAPFFFPLFGVVFVVMAVVGGIKTMTKAGEFERERELYEMRRQRLLQQLDGREG